MLGTGHFDRQGSKIISRRGHWALHIILAFFRKICNVHILFVFGIFTHELKGIHTS